MPAILGTSKQYSTFSPVNIPGCALWLDAADSSTITASSGSVSQWKDKSGNGNNGTATGSPTLSGGGILFNGSSQYITGPVSVTGSNLTVFTVANTVAGGSTFTAGRIVSGAATGTNDFDNTPSMDILVYNPFSSLTLMSFRNYVALSSVTTPTNARFLAVSQTNATTNTVYLNGTAGTATSLTGAAVGAFNMGQYSVATGLGTSGSIAYYNGYVYEVLFYSADLTTVQRQQIEQYLINKWLGGLPGTASTFTYTGAAQTYSVPPRVTALNVYMWGAGGGGAYTSGGTGGAGAFVTGSLSVSPGQTLTLVVGGGGTLIPYNNNNVTAGAYGGGGGSGRYGQGGGGRSAIQFTAGTDTVTAGGGGGGGDQNNSTGAPGGSATFSGTANSGSGSQGGGGASQTAGGAVGGGNKTGSGSSAPTAGSQYLGGQCDDSAGSGGGGYYGGGGSANGGYNACGGGGGSSYTANLSLISGSAALGSNSTNGVLAPATSSPYYVSGVAVGGTSGTSTVSARVGGNGLIVIVPVIPSFPVYTRPFQPIDIPGCVLWLDAADLASLTFSSASNVSAWKDKSGNGFNGTSIGNAGSTVWSSNGLNGYPTIAFDGVTSSFAGTPSVTSTNTLTIFTVAFMTAGGSANTYPHMISLAPSGSRDYNVVGGTYLGRLNNTNFVSYRNSQLLSYNPFSLGVPFVGSSVFDGTSNYTYVNSATNGSVASSGNFTYNTYNVGRIAGDVGANTDCFFIGSISEVIIFTTALTTSQRQQIEGYLANKWGLAASLPGGGAITTPTQLPGCVIWLDAADAKTLTLSSSSVTQWADKSGLGYHAVGNTGTGTYSSNGFADYPTIQITSSGNMKAPVPAGTFSTAVSAFIVWQKTGASTGCDALVFRGSGANPGPFDMYSYTSFGDTRKLIGDGSSFSQYIDSINFFRNTNRNIYFFNLSTNAKNSWNESVNGTYTTLTTSNGSVYGDTGSYIFIGTRADGFPTMIGNISEIVFYNSTLSTSQRQSVEGYLATKWGLRSSLPSTHPYYTTHPFANLPPYSTSLLAPTQIPGCVVWFDAADTNSLTKSGTTVTGWTNKSGQSAASTGGGTVSINQAYLNGVSSVRFPAGTNYLSVGAITFTTTDRAFFVVATNGSATGQTIAFKYYSAAGSVAGAVYGYNGKIELNKQNTNGLIAGSPSGLYNATSIVSICTPVGNQGIWVNGTGQSLSINLVGSTAFFTTGTTAAGDITLGGGNVAFDLYELIQYDGALTTSQRQAVEGYLSQKWGLTSSLPSTHPYVKITPGVSQ